MNFSQLVKTLVDYLDVGKRLATTIPGMVLAFGFVLFFAQAPDVLRQNRLTQDLDAELATLARLRAERIDLEQTKDQEQLRDTMAGEVLSGYEKQRADALSAYVGWHLGREKFPVPGLVTREDATTDRPYTRLADSVTEVPTVTRTAPKGIFGSVGFDLRVFAKVFGGATGTITR